MLEQSVTLRPHRTERVITASRLPLAMFLVLAIELDRTEPARHAAIVELLALGYLAYAAGLFLVTWLRHTTARHIPLATHIVDLVLFSVVMHLTEGPTSPFFIYFVFATVCGALRWHGRGALPTGIAALAAYVIVAMVPASALLMDDNDIDQTRFITRCTQLAVITLLLAYFGTYQRRLQTEIASLAAWPRRLPARQENALHDVLTSAAAILRVPRIVLAWQEDEEPSLRVAFWIASAWMSHTSRRTPSERSWPRRSSDPASSAPMRRRTTPGWCTARRAVSPPGAGVRCHPDFEIHRETRGSTALW